LTGVGAQLIHHERDGRAAAGRDDRLPPQVGNARVRRRRRAVGGEGSDHLVGAQPLDHELVWDLAGEEAEGSIELVGGETAEHVGGDAFPEADLDAGMIPAEAGQQAGDVDVARGQEGSDPDAPTQPAAKLVDLLAGPVELGEHPAGANGEHLSRLRRRDSPARAFEQWRAELALELPDLMGQCRLGDVELFGCSREVTEAIHGLDGPELAHVQGIDRKERSLY
jgi:hypothetical protein